MQGKLLSTAAEDHAGALRSVPSVQGEWPPAGHLLACKRAQDHLIQ